MPVPPRAECGAGALLVGRVRRPVAGDVGGAGVVAQELVAVRGGPQVAAGFEHRVAPAGVVGLEPVVATAQGRDVVAAGAAALAVGDHVVQVAGLGGAGAPREHTCQVPFGCLGGEPVGDLVPVDRDLFG